MNSTSDSLFSIGLMQLILSFKTNVYPYSKRFLTNYWTSYQDVVQCFILFFSLILVSFISSFDNIDLADKNMDAGSDESPNDTVTESWNSENVFNKLKDF